MSDDPNRIGRQRPEALALALVLAVTFAAFPVRAEKPLTCDATSSSADHRLPLSQVPEVVKQFGLQNVSVEQVLRSTVLRCFEGHLLACNEGANLPCGKAITQRALPQAKPWCAENPNVDFVPAYISGHDSIFHWRCQHGEPVTFGEAERVDTSGYITRYWKVLP